MHQIVIMVPLGVESRDTQCLHGGSGSISGSTWSSEKGMIVELY